jgi:hypothetical protein
MRYNAGVGPHSCWLTMGPLCSQVRGLCGEDPRQPSADGDRHECEALDGAPVVVFSFFTF